MKLQLRRALNIPFVCVSTDPGAGNFAHLLYVILQATLVPLAALILGVSTIDSIAL